MPFFARLAGAETILVVEDEPIALQRILARERYEALGANSAKEARKAHLVRHHHAEALGRRPGRARIENASRNPSAVHAGFRWRRDR
jgi:hypothetical protein